MDDFKGRVAVVTGGGSGIGEAMAKAFAREGSKVVLADVDRARMDRVAGEIASAGGEAIGMVADVTKLDAVEAVAQRTIDHFGAVHIVCNNAGVGVFGPVGNPGQLVTAEHSFSPLLTHAGVCVLLSIKGRF